MSKANEHNVFVRYCFHSGSLGTRKNNKNADAQLATNTVVEPITPLTLEYFFINAQMMKSTLTIPPNITGSIKFASDFLPVEKNDISINQISQGAITVAQFILVNFEAPLITK